ncbi:cytochrome c biogenesis protein CCS1, chloroplastic [Tanacetum coccineum]
MNTLLTLNPLKLQTTHTSHVRRKQTYSYTPISCKLTSKDTTTKNKVVVPGSAPSLSEEGNGPTPPPPPKLPPKNTAGVMVKRLTRRVLSSLANLPLALGFDFRWPSAKSPSLLKRGTAIDQGEAPEYYIQKYSEDNPILGFFTWRWILTLGFDHMFSSPVFLGTLILLGASLMACTYTTQIPMVKVARRWSFLQSANTIRKLEFSDSLPKASIKDLGVVLSGAGYEVLLTVSHGLNFVMGDVLGPKGFLSTPTEAFNTEVHVNRFYMDYYDSGEVSQFHTDLSLFDIDGKEVMRKTISVNDPLRYEGVTIYQTDWSISALQVLKDGEGPFNLAVAPLTVNGDKKLYGSFLPIGNTDSTNVKGISMLLRDLQSLIEIVDAIGSSGLDMKIWALQDGTTVVIRGKTNRTKIKSPEEMNCVLDRVPEINEPSDAICG